MAINNFWYHSKNKPRSPTQCAPRRTTTREIIKPRSQKKCRSRNLYLISFISFTVPERDEKQQQQDGDDEEKDIRSFNAQGFYGLNTPRSGEKKYLVEEEEARRRKGDVDWKSGIKLERNRMEMCKKRTRCLLHYTMTGIVLLFVGAVRERGIKLRSP